MTITRYPLADRDEFWDELSFGELMAKTYFNKIMSTLTLRAAQLDENDPFCECREWSAAYNHAWQGTWTADTDLIPDESMVKWTVLGAI